MFKFEIEDLDSEDCCSLLEVVVEELDNEGLDFQCNEDLTISSSLDLSYFLDELKSIFPNLNYKLS